MPTFENFEQLDDPDFFVRFVKEHFETAWPRIGAASGSRVLTDENVIKLAFDLYAANIRQYTVALHSKNPDHYKRSGAELFAKVGDGVRR
jgi:hypothetical protein